MPDQLSLLHNFGERSRNILTTLKLTLFKRPQKTDRGKEKEKEERNHQKSFSLLSLQKSRRKKSTEIKGVYDGLGETG